MHCRDFLNTVTTDIIHLHDNKLHQYKGNFAQFDEMYEQRRREVCEFVRAFFEFDEMYEQRRREVCAQACMCVKKHASKACLFKSMSIKKNVGEANILSKLADRGDVYLWACSGSNHILKCGTSTRFCKLRGHVERYFLVLMMPYFLNLVQARAEAPDVCNNKFASFTCLQLQARDIREATL